MKVKIFNEDNLKESEIDEKVTRVKVFLVNEQKQVLVAYSGGGIQLVGGHVEAGEKMTDTIKREVLEEAGIDITDEMITSPFFEIIYYTKNYKNSEKNRLSNIYYYRILTEKTPNLDKMNLTEDEKKKGFQLNWLSLDEYEDHVRKFLDSDKEISRNVANEMLLAFDEYNQVMKDDKESS